MRLEKMLTKHTTPINYYFVEDDENYLVNRWLGKKISLEFKNQITCLGCDQAIKKTFANGFCYKCFQSLAQNDACILSPNLCHYHKGTCREPSWGEEHCLKPHVVYLANTSGLKVGVTRKTQIPTRWIDQGAVSACPIIETRDRRSAGMIEKLLGETVNDKTNFRNMLKGIPEPIDFEESRKQLFLDCGDGLDDLEEAFGEMHFFEEIKIYEFSYPILEYPKKIKSLSFDKTEKIEGTLLGIKGQYLIFDTGVINVRNHGGYHVEFKGMES